MKASEKKLAKHVSDWQQKLEPQVKKSVDVVLEILVKAQKWQELTRSRLWQVSWGWPVSHCCRSALLPWRMHRKT